MRSHFRVTRYSPLCVMSLQKYLLREEKKVDRGVIGINFRAVFVPYRPGGDDGQGHLTPDTPAHFRYILQGLTENGTAFDIDFHRKYAGPGAVNCVGTEPSDDNAAMKPLTAADAELVRALNRSLSGNDFPHGRPLVFFTDEDVERIRSGDVPMPETLPPELVYRATAPTGMRMA